MPKPMRSTTSSAPPRNATRASLRKKLRSVMYALNPVPTNGLIVAVVRRGLSECRLDRGAQKRGRHGQDEE